ncbi:MAG: nitronate monooxygenase [Lachnospiraceae bacterium]|nr:nitronate monooxygenase [Lachnospiraceae bacterium]
MKNISEILGIKYPLIQGGMANIATGEFAAAVSNAGGLGLIATGGVSADGLREEIRKCKKLTKEKFGVNLMLMHPQSDEIADILVEEGVKIVTTGAGNPAKYMKKWKEAGIFVMPVVAGVALAKLMVREGADAIIAEGTESGGHVGEMTTMTLVPQVVDAVEVPVIAAGGIADGRQLAAAFALGAAGAQIGTCLLVSEECPIHQDYKNAVIKAKDSDTVVTGRIAGTPVRVLKNQMAREYVKKEKQGADRMELEEFTLGSLRKAVYNGDTKQGSLMAGQVAGQLKEIRPISVILEELLKDCNETMKALASRWS